MIGREGALVLLLGAFSLSKWTAQGKRHEFIKHFGTTKSGGVFFFFPPGIKSLRWKISPSSVLALWLSRHSLGFAPQSLPTIFAHTESREGKPITLLGKSLPSPPKEQVCCHRSRTTGLQSGPPAHGLSRQSQPVARHTAAGWPALGGTGSSWCSHLHPRQRFMNRADTSPAKEHHW